MKTVYLGLGTNLGDREANLQKAVDAMEREGVRLTCASSTYETRPLYLEDQPSFLNIVVEARTDAFPRVLLARLQRVEGELGRKRLLKNGPRTIDIDLLLYGRALIDTAELVVPHPRIEERRFVLEPLVEISPSLRHPRTRRLFRDALAVLPPQGVRQVAFRVQLKNETRDPEGPRA